MVGGKAHFELDGSKRDHYEIYTLWLVDKSATNVERKGTKLEQFGDQTRSKIVCWTNIFPFTRFVSL